MAQAGFHSAARRSRGGVKPLVGRLRQVRPSGQAKGMKSLINKHMRALMNSSTRVGPKGLASFGPARGSVTHSSLSTSWLWSVLRMSAAPFVSSELSPHPACGEMGRIYRLQGREEEAQASVQRALVIAAKPRQNRFTPASRLCKKSSLSRIPGPEEAHASGAAGFAGFA